MKIQCNVCEAAEANVLCCADEAALCWACDDKVHAANKLASKHQRVPLSNSSSPQFPKCDICQEMAGFFFCLEDRALLCRKCDVAIHTANEHVSVHQRFLLTGVKVGLEPTDPLTSSSSGKSPTGEKLSGTKSEFISATASTMPVPSSSNDAPSIDGMKSSEPFKVPFPEGYNAGAIQQWQLDDFFSLTGFNQNYTYMGNGSSKADSGKRSDSESSGVMGCGEEEMDNGGELCMASDSCWAVPEIPSPPTASGLCWMKSSREHCDVEDFVPDISSSVAQTDHDDEKEHARVPKRRRRQGWTLF
ncbi:B-box zinc finger protein 22 [Linum perenne]